MMSSKPSHMEDGCNFCEFIRLNYPLRDAEKARALVLVVKHLGVDHHYHVKGGPTGVSA